MRLPILALCMFFAGPAKAEVPQVVTDIPPVHALVAQVMGDLGSPILLLEPGADEHDFQMRPSQMQSLASASLIVWIGPELTPWLDRATAGTPAPMLALLDDAGTLHQAYPDHNGAGAPDHDAEPDQNAEHDHDAEHDHSGQDPHAWLNPDNAVIWLGSIAQALSAADPDNAAAYNANAKAAQTRIGALADQIAATLAPVQDRPFLTYHNAYGHFVARFGLTFAGSIADGEAALPGAAHLSEIQASLLSGKIICLFPEAQHDPALSDQLLAGTSTRLGGALDPVGSTLVPGPQAYDDLLIRLADTLAACLRG